MPIMACFNWGKFWQTAYYDIVHMLAYFPVPFYIGYGVWGIDRKVMSSEVEWFQYWGIFQKNENRPTSLKYGVVVYMLISYGSRCYSFFLIYYSRLYKTTIRSKSLYYLSKKKDKFIS